MTKSEADRLLRQVAVATQMFHAARRRTMAMCLGLCWLLPGAVAAQTAAPSSGPAGVAAVDPAFDLARRAFEALPEADRRAVQDALVWTADYKGVTSGAFGRGTRDAILLWLQRNRMPAGAAVLDEPQRAQLLALAAKTKEAVRWQIVNEPRSGIRIGVAQKYFGRTMPSERGARFSASDDSIALETASVQEPGLDLPALFERLKADGPQRKVTYKILRPDFLVVSGDVPGRAFYTRFGRGTEVGAPLRGYTLTWATAQKAQYDPVAIAIANSFEPFAAATGTAPAVVAAPASAPAAPAASAPGGVPSITPAGPPRPVLTATGIVVAPERVATSLPPGVCADLRADRRPAKILRTDAATGLSLLEIQGLPAPSLPPAETGDGGSFLALSFEAAAGGEPSLIALPVDVLSAADRRLRIAAGLQAGAGGTLLLTRTGALAGIVVAPATRPRVSVAGPYYAAAYTAVRWTAVSAALQLPAIKAAAPASAPATGAAPDLSAGALAARVKSILVPIICMP